MIIYVITNTTNGKKYVGMTDAPLNVRWRRHQTAARNGKNTYFCNAIRKYGPDVFVLEILCTCEVKDEAVRLEKEYIQIFDSHNPNKGYNLTDGGEGVWGWRHSKEAKLKMSKAKKGKPSPYWKGRIRSEETRRKMSLAKRRSEISGVNNSFFGKKHSEETRHKIGEARKGKTMSLETRLKIAKRIREIRGQKFWSTRKK